MYIISDKIYLYDCWYCGEIVFDNDHKNGKENYWGKTIQNRAFHEECKVKYKKEKEEKKEEYVRLKIEVMFERALRMMEKQDGFKINEYKEAAEVIIEVARKDSNKFASSHEMMAAMELIKHRYLTKVQYKVLQKRVDMVIPELKVALEIDGHLHKFVIGKDSERDVIILNELNKEEKGWEIIRIPSKSIENDLNNLIPTIKGVYEEKQKLRAKHNGFIPSYYSRNNLSSHLKALQGVSDKTKNSYRDAEFKEQPR